MAVKGACVNVDVHVNVGPLPDCLSQFPAPNFFAGQVWNERRHQTVLVIFSPILPI